MTDVSLDALVEATVHVKQDRRTFDDSRGWLHPAIWESATGRPGACAAAILAAVADVAGFHASAGFDVAEARDQKTLRCIAADLRAAAEALEATVNDATV